VIIIALFGILYFYSSESKQPFIGQPKALNKALLMQEIENGRLLIQIDSIINLDRALQNTIDSDEGIFFEVQIGGIDNFSLKKFNDNIQKINYSTMDGSTYITLGKFRDVDDAKLYIEDLKSIGINNAIIVSKLDGEIISIGN
jgi:hypothetical protein